ncbi:MAG TPA: hypothetical protein VKA84_10345 [Gemmatimonadaceae bacterium]|nr:hypothetical protein [Gemmatimonadaceae bacterium]
MAGWAIAALLGGATAGAQAPDARLAERLDRETYQAVLAVLDSARADGLPVGALAQKALEGASRGATGPRIATAVGALGARMRVARTALGARSSEAELVAGAGALYLGVAPTTLTRLRRSQPEGSVALPLVVLSDVIGHGVQRDTAASAIITLAEAKVPAEAFSRLRTAVAEDIRAGAAPAAAVSMRVRGILVGAESEPTTRRAASPLPRPGSP